VLQIFPSVQVIRPHVACQSVGVSRYGGGAEKTAMTTLQLLGLFLAYRLLTVVGCYLLLGVSFWCVDWYKTR
jgi:hypothetical protein